MRLEQLQYLIHIAEVGSIAKSAPDFYISQRYRYGVQAITLKFNDNQPKDSCFEGLNGHF